MVIDTINEQHDKIKEQGDMLAQLKPPLAKAPTGYRLNKDTCKELAPRPSFTADKCSVGILLRLKSLLD